ncbi:SagB family peptide dehydrogenase [Streptomyces gibsoniae]|uniref:SagB family peptide dehydrogenase n=1 Tax=Streptomyces gibsoniae TaxID=3075529 RepID=A0ABU2U093_9ACTN|nr:SagB family peptide dehydrogenase [Streptomyces sp. DSM 41699]MDT0466638.1 SagB family peptide dehydrogenase [Streptomyces sp. DSM 41699]
MGYAHEYATAVMRRGRIPMEPADFVPDWSDRPRKGKFFPGAPSFPLPDGGGADDATLGRGLFGQRGTDAFTLPLLGAMLRDSYGLTGRRLAVQANTDLGSLPFHSHANWSRGTASGGGLYPIGIHWVSGANGPLTPGVYYYDTPRHSLTRLLSGDVTGEVHAALGNLEEATGTDQFLVLGVTFWQNSFKYNSFCYHAVTMDIGALLQTWRMWARAHGLHLGSALWFDEPRLSRLLGLDPEQDGVFAVVPLRWAGDTPAAPAPPAPAAQVRRTPHEKSRRVLSFETLHRIHSATVEGSADRPAPGSLDPALAAPADSGERVPLPVPAPLDTPVRRALRERRSSFGRFTAVTPLEPARLSAALAAAVAAGTLDSDTETPGGAPLTRLCVFVNHVRDVPAGLYEYDRDTGDLVLMKAGDFGAFLQHNYFLANYNVEQAAAVLVPVVRTHAVLDAVGDRGYRLVNAAVGATAQAVYTAMSAAGTACGVALGFDSVSFEEELGLAERGEFPLLIMMIGHERPRPADYRYDIVAP